MASREKKSIKIDNLEDECNGNMEKEGNVRDENTDRSL